MPPEVDLTPSQPPQSAINKIKQDQKNQQKSHLKNLPTKDRPKPPRLSKTKNEDSKKVDYDSSFPDRVHTSLSKECVTELDSIIKQREQKHKKPKNSTRFNEDTTKKTSEETKETVDMPQKPLDSPKKRRSILKSLSGKHVKSEESNLLVKEDGIKDSADKEDHNSLEQNRILKPLEVIMSNEPVKKTSSEESTKIKIKEDIKEQDI